VYGLSMRKGSEEEDDDRERDPGWDVDGARMRGEDRIDRERDFMWIVPELESEE